MLQRMLLPLLVTKALAEAAGVFLVVFAGVGSALLAERWPQVFPAWCVPATWGGVIALCITALGPVSGAHFNPVVTLVLAVSNRLSWTHLPFYWGSQFAGGLSAIGLLMALRKI